MLSIKLHHFPFDVLVLSLRQPRRSLVLPASNYLRSELGPRRKLRCLKAGQLPFDSATMVMLRSTAPIRGDVRLMLPTHDAGQTISIPWAMQMKAISVEEPSRLVQTLTGAILGCGGWVLSRGANDTGTVNMLFEFERQACVEIYSVMIAAGLELSQSGHIRFTELCQCTRSHQQECGTEIASIDLEIQTFPVELMHSSSAAGLA
jgi:hypothetical protein